LARPLFSNSQGETTLKKKPTNAKKKPVKASGRKRLAKKPTEPSPYVMPKTAAEHGITCLSPVAGSKCGAPVIWFDYELGEKEFYKGFVCDAHKVSDRVEKLAQPQSGTAIAR
jgi:hypothetical protein